MYKNTKKRRILTAIIAILIVAALVLSMVVAVSV